MTLEIMSTNQWIVLVDHLVWLQAVLYISLIHQNTVYVYDGDMGIRRLQACGLRGIKASRKKKEEEEEEEEEEKEEE